MGTNPASYMLKKYGTAYFVRDLDILLHVVDRDVERTGAEVVQTKVRSRFRSCQLEELLHRGRFGHLHRYVPRVVILVWAKEERWLS